MKTTILLIIFLIFSSLLEAQDIVYDSIRGNTSNWRRIKFGVDEVINNTWYENEGFICRSKVLLSARVWDGLQRDKDYKIISFPFPTDNIIFEFKTTGKTNLIIYKFYSVDTIYYVGLRKAGLGDDLFTGKYLFVCPLITKQNCTINIYNGIGSNRTLFLSLKDGVVTDIDCTDYQLSDQVTFQVINGTKLLLQPTIKEFVPIENLEVIYAWPNPVYDILNVTVSNNIRKRIVSVYNLNAQLLYQEYLESSYLEIEVLNYKPGVYILVITDYFDKNIIYTTKIIVQ